MRRGWALWVLALAAVAGVVLGLSGYVMAGSFSVSNPDQIAHWPRVGVGYANRTVLSAGVFLAGFGKGNSRGKPGPHLPAPPNNPLNHAAPGDFWIEFF